jgi:hypothetical protein
MEQALWFGYVAAAAIATTRSMSTPTANPAHQEEDQSAADSGEHESCIKPVWHVDSNSDRSRKAKQVSHLKNKERSHPCQ